MAQPLIDDAYPPTEVNSARDDPERMIAMMRAAPNVDRHAPMEQIAGDGSEDTQDVLRIEPSNKDARKAFDGVARSAKRGSLDPLHIQYLHITGKKSLLAYEPENVRGSGGETTDEDPSQSSVYTGHYRVNFALPSISKGPTWVMGRGSGGKFGPTRNVDIILVAPGTKGVGSLAAAHLYLRMYPESGVWRLTAGARVKVEDRSYLSGEDICLCRPKTRIEILDMQYLIQFQISTPGKEFEYIRQRNAMLVKEGFTLPRTEMSGIPFQGDIVSDSIVYRQGLGSGSHGTVFEGFDPKSGRLRVAKRIELKSARGLPDVKQEIQALERFDGRVGIIKLIDWWTSRGGKDLLADQYPMDIVLIHDKGVAFNSFDWTTVSWDVKRSLCYQLLIGLTAIHGEDCMHRDITSQNILIFPYEDPPKAVLCDFGKFCDTPTEVETRLAAWQYLPPELEENQKHPYNQSLDIWMLGLALTISWWVQTKRLRPRENNHYKTMQGVLRKDKDKDVMLGDLLADMMARDPSRRPSAADALKYKTLRQCSAAITRDMAPSTTMKRAHKASD